MAGSTMPDCDAILNVQVVQLTVSKVLQRAKLVFVWGSKQRRKFELSIGSQRHDSRAVRHSLYDSLSLLYLIAGYKQLHGACKNFRTINWQLWS